jgi:predicted phosphodiesterase
MSQRLTNTQICRDALAEFPDHPVMAVARVVYQRHPARFRDYEAARWAVRSVIPGNMKSKKTLRSETLRRPLEGITLPPLPESKAKPWVRFEIGPGKILVLSDIHVPFHDPTALEAALAHGDKVKPDVVLLNGDAVDFHSISRFLCNPEERDLAGELAAIRGLLGHLRARFKRARIVYKLGNHEERWWAYLWGKAPELLGCSFATFEALIEAEKYGVEVVQDGRIIMAGKLPILHGHEWRGGISTPVNPARGAFLKAIACVMQGHLHRSSEHSETDLDDRLISTWSTGCLCDLKPAYARINRWNHGFATIDVDRSGAFEVSNKRILKGDVL